MCDFDKSVVIHLVMFLTIKYIGGVAVFIGAIVRGTMSSA